MQFGLENGGFKHHSKKFFVEIDIDSVKVKQKNLDEKSIHMETNSKFVDDGINQLQSSLEKK